MFRNLFTHYTTALFTLFTLLLAGTTAQDADAARKRRSGKYQWVVKGKVNINHGSATKLRCLPGIGAKKAQSIVTLRSRKPFTSLTQLRSIKGIGKKLYARILPYITLSGETTISKTRVRRTPKE
ncbi:helix-hairpin-helix domain-containing protein [Myxococcota bacterium]|nr:helix-hairpin-helix domain-containing protein [Myxococcota bacterium]